MNNNNADDVSGLNCVSLQNAFFQHTGKTFAIGSLWLFHLQVWFCTANLSSERNKRKLQIIELGFEKCSYPHFQI